MILVPSRGDATAEQKLLSPSWLCIPHYKIILEFPLLSPPKIHSGVPELILEFPLLSPSLAAVLRVLDNEVLGELCICQLCVCGEKRKGR